MIPTQDDWGSDFGDDYTDRNPSSGDRSSFWKDLCSTYEISSVLEVGCGSGHNFAGLRVPNMVGVDVNEKALAQVPDHVSTHVGDATMLDFATDLFDLVLTFGLLVHIPPDDLQKAMREIVRVSRRYVFAGEYLGDDEVDYRGGVLWRRDYGGLYQDMGLTLVEQGLLEGAPWDRGEVHWWLLEEAQNA